MVSALAFGVLSAGILGACGLIEITAKDGSGSAETVVYDFDSFDQVDIGNGFEADITIVDGPPSVEITMDDNLVEDLEVKVDGDELIIGMKNGMYDFKVVPEAVISMPSITKLDASGATDTTLVGLAETDFEVEVSGASRVTIEGTADRLVVDTSGASFLEIEGSANEVRIDASGASKIDLSDLAADTASIDLSGSSSVELDQIARVTGEASGASSVEVESQDAVVTVNTSGSASVDQG